MWDDDPGPRGWCRKCFHFEFADNDGGIKMSPEEMAQLRREARERRLREEAVAKLRAKMLWHKRPWREWHADMPEFARQLWRNEGIDDWDQEDYQLGFRPDLVRWDRDNEVEVKKAALTIPYLVHNKNHVRQIQYRLLKPGPFGKYYFHKRIAAPLFLSTPFTLPQGRVLVVEGAKKCIVVKRLLGREFDRVVALPGSNFDDNHFDELLLAEHVTIMLDPDVPEAAAKLARELNAAGVTARWVALPAKPDDMVVKYGISAAGLMEYIKLAR
jgi:hypothetical protein